jgi:hypothetical protein
MEERAFRYEGHRMFAEKADTDTRYWVFVELAGLDWGLSNVVHVS